MHDNFSNRRPRNGTGADDGNENPSGPGDGSDGGTIPGYCVCGRPAGRTGRCATCDSNDRRINRKSNNKKPRTRIRARSKKQLSREAEYTRERASWLPGKKCAVFPWLDATEIHHRAGRVGYVDSWSRAENIPALNDKRFWLPVSRAGHEKIEMNPVWAKKNGFSVPRY